MTILRGSSEVKRMTQMLPITLQARHTSKMLGDMLNIQSNLDYPDSLGLDEIVRIIENVNISSKEPKEKERQTSLSYPCSCGYQISAAN